jgi:protein-S-isoprenylcysteine O-methyltransferase Ste14
MDEKLAANVEKPADLARLKKMVFIRAFLAVPVMGLIFFVPAGTLRYWQAWVYMAILLVPMFGVMSYFLKKDPKLLERRMRTKEKEATQKKFLLASSVFFAAGYLLPGFDRRYGWSSVPLLLVAAADVLVVFGYAIFVRVLLENRFLSRVVEVDSGQKIITTGPYAVVRHPMYAGTTILYLATPLALGSYWALIPFALFTLLFPIRILNEEMVLLRGLPEYAEYMKKTRYRLVPGIW